MQALIYILDALITLVVIAFLLRALFPVIRADFRNPIGQAVLRVTDPLVLPLRRVLRPAGRVDVAAIVALVIVQIVGTVLVFGLAGAPMSAALIVSEALRQLARTVLQNYGRRKTPVWTTTQLAMTGAELKDSTPQVAAAFTTVLNLKAIGELLGAPVDTNRLLYGPEWYFYARSYGMHLHRLKDTQAEEYLPAQVEFAPVSAARQAQVGEFRLQSNELPQALAHFELALDLEPDSVQGLDGQAVVWMRQGQTEKATANWLKLTRARPLL